MLPGYKVHYMNEVGIQDLLTHTDFVVIKDYTIQKPYPEGTRTELKKGDQVSFIAKLRGHLDTLYHFVHYDSEMKPLGEFDVHESELSNLRSSLEREDSAYGRAAFSKGVYPMNPALG